MHHKQPTIDPEPAAPIACTLTPGAFAERTALIIDLNRRHLRAHRQDDLVLELAYERAALMQVRELIQKESECCAFLGFELTDEADRLRLRITAPGAARDWVGVLFAPFLAGADD